SLNGNAWTTFQPTSFGGAKLAGAAGDDNAVYAVGAQSAVVRILRSAPAMPVVSKVSTMGSDANRALSAVGAGSGYVFAVGDSGSVFCSRSSGQYWTRLPLTSLPNATFNGVYGNGKQLWIVGQNAMMAVVVTATLP